MEPWYEDEGEAWLQDAAAVRVCEEDIVPVMTVSTVNPNGTTTECIIDTGSALVIMREDIANANGFEISNHRQVSLQSANGTHSRAVGIIERCPFEIGGIQFRIPVHVVSQAPFDVLLGMPFVKFARMKMSPIEGGRVVLTLRDPCNLAQLSEIIAGTRTLRKTSATRKVQGF